MDDFNAKKSRASKMRQDKWRDRPKKHVDSGAKGTAKGNLVQVKDPNQGKSAQDSNVKEATTTETAEHVEEDSRSFSKRKLTSNWDRYEEPVGMNRFEEEVDVIGAHFEELLSMPISGGHLKMKREHEWEKEKSELQMPWFQLDIQGVEQNLSTILFTKRQDLPQNIFSENHLQRMMVRAKRNASSLAEVNASILKVQSLNMTNVDTSQAVITDKSSKEPSILNIKSSHTTLEPPKVKESDVLENEDIDDILALHESSKNPNSSKISNQTLDHSVKDIPLSPSKIEESLPPAQSETSDSTANSDQPTVSLDDWLDSILDD